MPSTVLSKAPLGSGPAPANKEEGTAAGTAGCCRIGRRRSRAGGLARSAAGGPQTDAQQVRTWGVAAAREHRNCLGVWRFLVWAPVALLAYGFHAGAGGKQRECACSPESGGSEGGRRGSGRARRQTVSCRVAATLAPCVWPGAQESVGAVGLGGGVARMWCTRIPRFWCAASIGAARIEG